MLESNAYKTYYAFASGEKTAKLKYVRKKADSDTSPKQKPVQATKGTRIKSKAKVAKSDIKKQPTKKPKDKVLVVLSKVMELTLSQRILMSDNEDKDNENDSDDISDEGDDDHDGNDGDDDDANDDDKQESDNTYDDDEETDKEEEKIDDEETMDEEEDDEVTKELYDDVNVNLGNEDTKMTNADQGASEQQNFSQESRFEQVEKDAHVTLYLVLDTQKADEPVQSSSVSSDFTSKLLNLENPSPADNEITSLMETSACHATTVPKNTSGFTITIPPPLYLSSIFRFNDRVTNLEKDLSEIKQVNLYAQALSSIPAIVNRYMDNKLRETINKAILAHNLECRQEDQDEKNAYIELVDTSIRPLIKK
ncbi:hypothetical protein Tco_1305869, partial [Tanacetum coccineum]